jgi:hypothetical protein
MADSTLAIKAFAIIMAIAFAASALMLIDVNNKYLDLADRYNTQSLELAQLKYANTRLEETLRDVNATLISTQKTPLVEASLNQLLKEETSGNITIRWMWILDSGDVDSIEIPFSVLGVDIRLVSQDDVKSMTMKANGTRLYLLDGVSLTDSTHGVVKFSLYYVFSVGGVPSTYGVHKITYFMERRAGDWTIYGTMGGFEDYFQAVPLFDS